MSRVVGGWKTTPERWTTVEILTVETTGVRRRCGSVLTLESLPRPGLGAPLRTPHPTRRPRPSGPREAFLSLAERGPRGREQTGPVKPEQKSRDRSVQGGIREGGRDPTGPGRTQRTRDVTGDVCRWRGCLIRGRRS